MPQENLQPPVPAFPAINLNLMPDGLLISIHLAPGLTINHMIVAQMLDQVAQKWIEIKKQQQSDLKLIQKVKATRN